VSLTRRRWLAGWLAAAVEWYRSHPDHWDNIEQVLVPHPVLRTASSATH